MQKLLQPRNNRSLAFRLKTVSAAVVSALVVVHASAAGLGKLTVLSALGQPLRAEIELTAVSADDARNLQPKLASMEAFRQANIEFNPTLQSLRFAVEQRGSRQFIQITTTQPISEPFVDVLLELNGSSGRLVREYTFLLDPPELRSVQPSQTSQNSQNMQAATSAAGAVVAGGNSVRLAPEQDGGRTQSVTKAQLVPRTPKPAAAPVREAAPVAARAPNGNSVGNAANSNSGNGAGAEYKVQNGDSLSKIANRMRSDGVSLDQMLVALYRANPDAFIGSNMNRLRAGQILSVPNAETSGAVAANEATGIVIAQAADFNEYRNKLAGLVSAAPAQKAAESRQSASGKIAAKVEERPTAASEALDKLKLSKADAATAGKSAAVQEDRVAREKANADAASRVKDLEKNVSDLQKMLEIKSRDLADRQKAAAPAAAVVAAAAPAKAPVPATPPAAATPTPAPVVATAAPAAPAATTPAAAAAVVAAPVAAAQQALDKVKAETPPAKPDAPVKPKVAPEKAEPGLFDEPLSNPLVQGGAVVLALLLAGLAFMRSRGKKKSKDFTDSTIPESSLKANSLFGSTGGQSVDTNNSVFNSSFAPAASNLDSNEVDPVAEADVYIAYGRDVQAEEILKEALRTQPERHAVRVKLLEIYASRKDTRAFESVATELYSMSKGEGDEWAQAAAMGLALDPANPLYASGKLAAAVPHEAAALGAAKPAEDTADLDAFLEEVSGAHPFADTHSPAAHAPAAAESHSGLTALEMAAPVAAAAAAGAAVHSSHAHSAAASDKPHEAASASMADTPAAASDNSLDFDLDGMNFDAADKPASAHDAAPALVAAVAPAAPAAAADEAPLSAMDFDFLQHDASKADAAHVAKPAEPAPMEFGEFHIPSEASAEPLVPAHAAAAPAVPVLPDATPAEKPETAFAAMPDLSPAHAKHTDAHAVDTADLTPIAAAPLAPQPLEFDLSGITLDLPEPEAAPQRHDTLTAPALNMPSHRFEAGNQSGGLQDDFTELDLTTVAEHDDAGSSGGISNSAEMATKLDLAVAYQEIGDQEGARELLDEVVKGGSAPQSEKARSLLARLG